MKGERRAKGREYGGKGSRERREARDERRETRGERREARDERRETRGERREARDERRETRGERREARNAGAMLPSSVGTGPRVICTNSFIIEIALLFHRPSEKPSQPVPSQKSNKQSHQAQRVSPSRNQHPFCNPPCRLAHVVLLQKRLNCWSSCTPPRPTAAVSYARPAPPNPRPSSCLNHRLRGFWDYADYPHNPPAAMSLRGDGRRKTEEGFFE